MVISIISKKTICIYTMPESKEELKKDFETLKEVLSSIDNEINEIKLDHEQITNKKRCGIEIGKPEEKVAPEKIQDI